MATLADATKVTDLMDSLVATLNENKPVGLQMSVWYSFNDGTWKWSYTS